MMFHMKHHKNFINEFMSFDKIIFYLLNFIYIDYFTKDMFHVKH